MNRFSVFGVSIWLCLVGTLTGQPASAERAAPPPNPTGSAAANGGQQTQSASAPVMPPPRPMAPALARPLERRLFSDNVVASSFLWNDWNRFVENYHANYVGDDDAATAWVEGVNGNGQGQWLRMNVTKLGATSVVRVRVRNGLQKSEKLYKANARVKTATITLLPSGASQTIEFIDRLGWQEFAVPQAPADLTGVELKIDSVFPGEKYEDLCISDVQVFATSTVADNPAFEKSKRQALFAWRAARMAAAKSFAQTGVGSVFAAGYENTASPLEGEDNWSATRLLAFLPKRSEFAGLAPTLKAAQRFASGEPFGAATTWRAAKLAPQRKTPLPIVDGLSKYGLNSAQWWAEAMLPMVDNAAVFFAERLRVIEEKSGVSPRQFADNGLVKCASSAPQAWVYSDVATEANAPARVAAVLLGTCGWVEDRAGRSLATGFQLLVYAPDGKLAAIVRPESEMGASVVAFRWGEREGAPVIEQMVAASMAGVNVMTARK